MKQERRSLACARRILFLPLANVVGHLARTFAVAEDLAASGHEVTIATTGTLRHMTKVLPRNIRLLRTPEMYRRAAEHSGAITHYDEGALNDRDNIEISSRMDEAEQRRRNRRILQMVARDREIVAEVRPHAIVTDYRFTTQLMRPRPPARVFHISHILGYPSLYRRVFGELPFPLDRERVLVPGVREVEYWRERVPAARDDRSETLCGVLRWRGWDRLRQPGAPLPSSDVLLYFGSTGNSAAIVPYLLRNIPNRSVHVARAGELGISLENTRVVFCHGGHGTVMECIVRRTPMVIFPHNLEQLEIGRRIDKMGLGVLVRKRYDEAGSDELDAIIAHASADAQIKANLARYSALLRQSDGARIAAATILRDLEIGDEAA